MFRSSATPAFPYQKFWCEENIWHLARHPATQGDDRLVLVLTGASGRVACWQQRVADPDAPVLWDYHVVLAVKSDAWRIWDLDTRLPCPAPAQEWLDRTFPHADVVPELFAPRFAVVDADHYLGAFGSDRAHMRDRRGQWLHQPPPWPAIAGHGLTLAETLRAARQGEALDTLRKRLTDTT